MHPLWTVAVINFGYSKHFDSYDEAKVWAKKSTFECVIYSPDMTRVATHSYFQGYREEAVLV